MRHPSFLIGATSYVVFLIGIYLKSINFSRSDFIILAGIVLGFIHWAWSLTDVFINYDLKPTSKTLWIIVVMLIPPLGGMIYYMMPRKNVNL